MTNLSGITVTPGIMPSSLRTSLLQTLDRIGAKVAESVRIDTTHFVCTEPRGAAWDRAREMNIPVVVPDWVKGCESEGRILGVRQYYLDADPRLRQVGPSVVTTSQQQAQQQQQRRPSTPPMTPSTKVTPPTPEQGPGPVVPPKDLPIRGSHGGDIIAEERETVNDTSRPVHEEDESSEEEGTIEDHEDDSEEEPVQGNVSSDEEEIVGQKRTRQPTVEDEPGFQDVAF